MIIAFDVNETLLDLAPLDRLLGDEGRRRAWFALMLQYAFVGGLTHRYVDYSSAQRAAAETLAPELDADALVDAMRSLPPHPDVVPGLTRLREAGFTLTALTNSPVEVARDQIANAGLDAHLDAVLSADQVRVLKPRREAYALVADTFGVPMSEVRLVAAHGWDVAGALAAGCAAAFVDRPGQALIPIGPQPDLVAPDVAALATLIVERDST